VKPQKSTTQKVLDVLASLDGWVETADVRKHGKWTDKESQNLGITLANLYTAGRAERKKSDIPHTGRGRPSYLYRITPADAPRPQSKQGGPKVTVCPSPDVKPLKHDIAAQALASPPRGKGAEVPSLASASLPHGVVDRPVRQLGPMMEEACTGAFGSQSAPSATWFVVAVSPRFDTLAAARKYAQDIAENETDLEVVVAAPVETLRLVPQWERV
jgi:hypothetical protein